MRRTATCTKVTMRMTRKMEWDSSPGRVAIIIRDVTKMMRDMAMEKCTGRTDLVTKVSGRKAYNTALEGCNFQMEESKKAYSRTTRLKDHRLCRHRR